MTTVDILPAQSKQEVSRQTGAAYSTGSIETFQETPSQFSISDHRSMGRPRSTNRTIRKELLRKLRGFVVQFETDTVRVALFDDKTGEKFHYRFPADRFIEAKIEVENQPFEMIESRVISSESSVPVYQTMFLPSAPSDSAELIDLDLGEKYEQMKKNIIERNSKRKRSNAPT